MSWVFRRLFAVGAGAVALSLAVASVSAGQGSNAGAMHNATRLGGSTSFYTPPLRNGRQPEADGGEKGHGRGHPDGAARGRHSGNG